MVRFAFAIGGMLAIGLPTTALAGSPLPEQLQTWLRDLDSEDYSKREAASHALLAAGPDAIDTLAQGVVSSSPEAAWRASETLSEIAIDGDGAVLERVAAALGQVRQSDAVDAKHADSLIQELRARQARVREERAAAKLRSLGARISGDEQQQAMIFGGGFKGGGLVVPDGGLVVGFGDIIIDGAVLEIAEAEEMVEDTPEKPLPLRALEETVGRLADLLSGAEAAIDEPPDLEIAPPVEIAPAIEIAPALEIPLPPVAPVFEPQLAETAADPAPPAAEAPLTEPVEPPSIDPPSIDVSAGSEDAPELVPPELGADEAVFIGEAFVSELALAEEGIAATATATLTLDSQWRGGDDGLAALRDLQNVSCLAIEQAPLTDAALRHIATLPNLRQLSIQKTPFSAAALYKLRTKRPGLQIVARGEAMLGVHADFAGPCVFTGISRGSGADEAGLKAGDRVISADDQKINDFSDLMIAVYGHVAGETLKLEVERGADRVAADVVLKPRSPLEN